MNAIINLTFIRLNDLQMKISAKNKNHFKIRFLLTYLHTALDHLPRGLFTTEYAHELLIRISDYIYNPNTPYNDGDIRDAFLNFRLTMKHIKIKLLS